MMMIIIIIITITIIIIIVMSLQTGLINKEGTRQRVLKG